MKKVILRKDYKTQLLPIEQAVDMVTSKRACKTWTETFVDLDTDEKVDIERCKIILEANTLINDAALQELKDAGIEEVEVSESGFRTTELADFTRLGHVKVTIHGSNGKNAVLIVRAESFRAAQDLAVDYCEGASEEIFGEQVNYVSLVKTEILNNIHFIGRTNKDIVEENQRLLKDPDASVKEPFKVKASFKDADFYNAEDKHPEGIYDKVIFVVWAYDVVTAKDIVFAYIKHKYDTVVNEKETCRIVGATQFYAHTYVPAEYCNEYIKNVTLKLKVEE